MNPEGLTAATLAGCSSMAFAFGLECARYSADKHVTEAAVTFELVGHGLKISRSALTLRAKAPKVDARTFARGRCRGGKPPGV